MGIEGIADAIESPFGKDTADLPLGKVLFRVWSLAFTDG